MNRLSLKIAYLPFMLGMLFFGLFLAGCADDGSPGASTGTATGVVTNSANSSAPIAGAVVTTSPDLGTTYTTDANGRYTANLPLGSYTLTFSATNFTPQTEDVVIVAATTETIDVELVPVSPVVVMISGAPDSTSPGDAFDLTASIDALDDSTAVTYAWTQTNSAEAGIENADTDTATITLGETEEYKDAVVEALEQPARWGVLGINPLALEEGGAVTFQCAVTTTSGTYTGSVTVHTELDFGAWSTGLRNVPIDVPVLMGSREQASYDWALTTRPVGSSAELEDGITTHPYFTPDVAGLYILTVYDIEEDADETLEIYAAEWVGGIDGQDAEGRPTMTCIECHDGIFPDIFADWAQTGHAEIFTDNVNTGGHYGPGCFDCHAVGYQATAENNGMDDTEGYDDFLATMFPGGVSHPDADNWDTILEDFPAQAQLANIQCEQCHGPNGTGGAHIQGHELGGPRVSAAADVCASCHGEPPRHARYQQWQESKHGNFETAIAEGTSGSCAKCHTAQGFLEWFENDLDTGYSTSAVAEGEIQPITCVVCHDPHNVGTLSGDANNVMMRVDGDSPPLLGGFTAYGLGHGALCIVCHNTRRGLANDTAGFADPDNLDRAPHGGAQGDVLMGQNAFFVTTGLRGGHSYISDTCSTCHMEITDPPAELSYQLSGTNHNFEADPGICSECHGLFDSDSLIALNEAAMEQLAEDIAGAIEAEILFHTGAPNNDTVSVTGTVDGVEDTVDITAASTINYVELVEYHGRAAMNISIDGTVVEGVGLSGGTELLDSGDTLLDNDVADNQGEELAKCCWNYFIIHNDGSSGVHNPSFVNDIIVSTTNMITTLWP